MYRYVAATMFFLLAWQTNFLGQELVAALPSDERVFLETDLRLFSVRPTNVEIVEPILSTGTILALRTTDLVPLVGGLVEEIMVGVGDRVEVGQALLRMRQRDFEITVERLRQSARLAAAERSNAKLDFENAVALVQRGALSKEQLDDRRTRYEAMNAKLGVAQANLAEAQQALDDSTLRAPYTGVITQRNIDEGAYVPPIMRTNQPVLQLQEIHTMVAVVFIPERYLRAIKIGTRGKVLVPGLGKSYDTQIHVINDRIDVKTRSIDVRLGIPNADYEMKPGQFIEVELFPEAHAVLSLPAEVVRGVGAQRYVFVNKNGIAKRTSVRVKDLQDGRVEVLEGISEKDAVIGGTDLNLVSDGYLLAKGNNS